MTPRGENQARTEDDLRAALSTLERHAPTVEWVLRATAQPAARRAPLARALRRPRLAAAAALTAAAVTVLAVTVLQPGGRSDGTSQAYLAAWAVQRHPGGWIRIELRQLENASGLQAALRADGVPVNVSFSHQPIPASTGAMASHCQRPDISDQAGAKLQNQIFPPTPGPLGPSGLHSVILIIRTPAIPAGIGVFIQGFYSPNHSGDWYVLNTGLVKTSPQCTGKPRGTH